ncbi:hypothetical protein QBC43DRAFT_326918 [Cladorrhinum sp. PSN259]|nr:hypothetical protein QBC43DRAFT_326918 [Cladorrhinum sp. PSN259]
MATPPQAAAKPSGNGAIEEFMAYYTSSGYLAYEKLGERTKLILVSELERHGIKHEMIDRGKEGSVGGLAKAPASARGTVLRRQRGRGKEYQTKEEIIADMHDLAGLRIALYYPNDFAKVEEIIKTRLVQVKPPQDWPDEQFGPFGYPMLDNGSSVGRKSRFPGYFARHFRARLYEEDVDQPAIRGKTLEVQVMTVLMHAWSKIYQELIYKPRSGVPQADEDDERLLDVANGIIIAGEQVLRQIQINLDKKRLIGLQPFKNENGAWSYVFEEWVSGKNKSLSPSQRLWVKECSEGVHAKGLYEGLTRVGLNNPEKIDLLIQQCIDAEFGPQGTQRPSLPLDNIMIAHLVNHRDFIAIEAKLLGLPNPTGKDKQQSPSLQARRARYYALIICNAFRRMKPNSLHLLWQHDFFNNPELPLPSGQDLLQILHPATTLRQGGFAKGGIANLEKFCKHLMGFQEPSWRFQCALARLGYFQSTKVGTSDLLYGITTCPLGLVAILNQCARPEISSVKQSFTLLEAAARDGFMGLSGNDQQTKMLPPSLRNYRCPTVVYMAKPGVDKGVGRWSVQERGAQEVVCVQPEWIITGYLDGLDG